MVNFIRHEIHENNGDSEIILYLDAKSIGLEEFAMEINQGRENLGQNEKIDVENAAYSYVKEHFPNKNFKRIKVMASGIVVATMLGTGLMLPSNQASAAEAPIEVSGQPTKSIGELTLLGTFKAVVLEGKTIQDTAQIGDFTVTDATGSGEGWTVYLNATPFTDNSKDINDPGRTLPTGVLSVEAPTLTDLDPSSGSSSPENIDKKGGLIDTGTPLAILTAPAGEGMGTYNVSLGELSLNLPPAGAYTGTYTSTITVSYNSGP